MIGDAIPPIIGRLLWSERRMDVLLQVPTIEILHSGTMADCYVVGVPSNCATIPLCCAVLLIQLGLG